MRVLFIVLVVLICGCKEREKPVCVEQKFGIGEPVIFKKTGERVRIVDAWYMVFEYCKFSGDYNVHFEDGSEIRVKQDELINKEIK